MPSSSEASDLSHALAVNRRRWRRVQLGVLTLFALAVGWFYHWTAFPIFRGPQFTDTHQGYYNLQANGFLKGQLALDKEADPALATMKNPWNPAERGGRGLHDATYYKGRYHMYFGIGPVLLLFLPFKLLTGVGIGETLASVIFSWGGFLAALALLWQLRNRYFPWTSGWWVFGCAAALGLSTMVPALLRRPSVWEVPITSAYLCVTVALFAVFRALHSRNAVLWTLCASTAMGFAVAARPVYVFACAALLPPLWYWSRQGRTQEPQGGARPRWRTLFAATVLPAALIGFGLALYNYLRFEDILEFGQKYQMAGDDVTKQKFFSWAYPWYGVQLYLLEPAGLTPYFPFFTVITAPPPPPGQLGVENPYGIFPNIPFVWLTLAVGLIYWRARRVFALKTLSAFVTTVLMAALLTMCTVMSFGGITNRYMVDFLPTVILAACIGSMMLLSSSWLRGYLRAVGLVLLSALLIMSVLFNLLISVQHNELLRVENPTLYRKLAHAVNWVPHLWDKVTGHRYGPVELKVTFADAPAGSIESLVVTGTAFRSDYVYVHYLGDNTIRFGFEHTSYGGATGQPVRIKPGEVHTLRVDMGSLYPPASHPYYDGMPEAQARAIQRTLRVILDGEVALQASTELYDGTSRYPVLGHSGARPAFKNPFSGKILSWRVVPELIPTPPPVQFGPLRLRVSLPAFSGIRHEPLVCSGETGRGDLIYIRYEGENRISFGHDHWGGGARTTESATIDPAAVQTIEIDFGALYPVAEDPRWPHPANRERLLLKLNGQTLYDGPGPFHPVPPDSVVIGRNEIGATSAFGTFSGTIESAERYVPAGAP